MPWGEEYTGVTLVDMYLAELAAHAWDLARATGQTGQLDPSLALPALEGARAMIKPQYRNHGREGRAPPVMRSGKAPTRRRSARGQPRERRAASRRSVWRAE